MRIVHADFDVGQWTAISSIPTSRAAHGIDATGGVGIGLSGGLGSGTQQVGKPERGNPVVCVVEKVNERN